MTTLDSKSTSLCKI